MDNQQDNNTLYDTKMNDKTYLNEVGDNISKEQITKINENNELTTIRRQNNSENEKRNEVLDDTHRGINVPDENLQEDNKNKTDTIVLYTDLSYNPGSNITNASLDAHVVASNTIESDEETLLKKPSSSTKEKTTYEAGEGHDDNKTIQGEYHNDKDKIFVPGQIKGDNDEENNLIPEEEEELDSKSQPFGVPKVKQIYGSQITSTSYPSTSDSIIMGLNSNVTSTHAALHKPLVTTTRESLNEVENDSLQSNLDENGMINSRSVKDIPKHFDNTKKQSNIQSPTRRKINPDLKKPSEPPIHDSAKLNELEKESIPVLLNQRAKRSTKDIFLRFKTFIGQLL